MKLNELLTEGDKIEGLPTGKDLFNQKFFYLGHLSKDAQSIIADKLAGRWAVFVQSLSAGDQGITDRHYSDTLDLGPYGHGFSDKASAQAYVRDSKKRMKAYSKHRNRSTHEIYTLTKVEDIKKTYDKLKPMLGDVSKSPLDSINLSYARPNY